MNNILVVSSYVAKMGCQNNQKNYSVFLGSSFFFFLLLNNPFSKSFAFVFISVFTSVLVVSLLGFVAFEMIEFKEFVP
jgi:hypothetical protein